MNKKLVAIITSSIIASALANAGTMGVVSSKPAISPYVTLDADYTWTDVDNFVINNVVPNRTLGRWGGRLGLGFMSAINESWAATAEIGGGYYGSVKISSPSNGIVSNFSLDGYDVLFGGIYNLKSWSNQAFLSQLKIFGSAGLMVQNARQKVTQNLALQTPGGVFSGLVTNKSSHTEALPELKVGMLYDVTESLALSVAYMHVFGSTPGAQLTSLATPTPETSIISGGYINSLSPTFDTILFGIRYNFA
jgi:hypothetical protein